MKWPLRISLFATALLALSTAAPAQDETVEPPVKYRLEVDGKDYPILEGEPTKLPGSLTNPTITLHAEPYRDFRYGGIAFSYPRSFSFEAEIDGRTDKHWTLSGNDFKIMYFVLAGDLSAEQFADEMMLQFGTKNCTKSKVTVAFNGEKRLGVRINMTLAGAKMTTDIFRLNSGSTAKLLSLQDSPDDAGRPSKESKEVMPMLQKTMRIK